MFRPIESFAEATLATEGGYPADARATETTTVLLVPKNEFVDLLRRRPDLALRVSARFHESNISSHCRVADDLTLKDMETRVANWLLKRCPRPNRGWRGRNQARPDQTRARGEELEQPAKHSHERWQNSVIANFCRIRGNTLTVTRPDRREIASTAPGRTLITAVACDVDSLAFFRAASAQNRTLLVACSVMLKAHAGLVLKIVLENDDLFSRRR